jgi:hypothetical protein
MQTLNWTNHSVRYSWQSAIFLGSISEDDHPRTVNHARDHWWTLDFANAFVSPGVNSRRELVPSHGASRRRLGDERGDQGDGAESDDELSDEDESDEEEEIAHSVPFKCIGAAHEKNWHHLEIKIVLYAEIKIVLYAARKLLTQTSPKLYISYIIMYWIFMCRFLRSKNWKIKHALISIQYIKEKWHSSILTFCDLWKKLKHDVQWYPKE